MLIRSAIGTRRASGIPIAKRIGENARGKFCRSETTISKIGVEKHGLNKGSPKVRQQARTEDLNAWPDQQHRDKITSQSSRKDASTQERDYRKAREPRPNREGLRPRDRHRDHPRYRAEATDGEQDVKRPRYGDPTERDRRRENNSGWMSDNYATQGRKVTRTATGVLAR